MEITARKLIQARQEIGGFFDPKLFSDPAYAILLGVMARGEERLPTRIEDCAREAGLPCTTASRWVRLLQERGLLARTEVEGEGRPEPITLTIACHAAMSEYLKQVADVLAQ